MCHHKNRPHAENNSKYDRYDSADGFVSLVSLASLSFYVINIAVFFLLTDIISRYFTYMISHLCHITYVPKGLKGRQAQFISTIVIFKKNLHEYEILEVIILKSIKKDNINIE